MTNATCAAVIDEPRPLSQGDNHIVAGSGQDRPAIRALHVINGEHYAGAERVQDLLAGRLPDFGVEVGFACLKPGQFAELRKSQATPLLDLTMRTRFDLRPAVRLARTVRRERYDVLHTHSARALLIARLAAAMCGVPIVHHVHGNTSSEVAGRRFTRLNAWAERKSLPAAAAVIAVSASVADYLQSVGVQKDRLHVVFNGVPARGALANKERAQNGWTLGFIALLRPRKGLETFLEAAALLVERDWRGRSENDVSGSAAGADPVRQSLTCRLRIVGRFETSEYEREVQALAQRLGLTTLIDWRGFQRSIDAELDAMDLLAFPSVLPEGMPMTVIEAMAAGVPIVASRVSGVTDVLRDREDALLVMPADAKALADAVATLVGDGALRDRLRQSAFARQRGRFSDANMAAEVANIYQQILTRKGTKR
jgi:glycosyltransferase involved in cell wall biosynthesis